MNKIAINATLEEIKTFLKDGGDINFTNKIGNTLLHSSAISGDTERIQYLIDNGADLDIQNDEGKTALWWAAFNKNNQIVKMLLKAGANPGLPTIFGTYPKEYVNKTLRAKMEKIEADFTKKHKIKKLGRFAKLMRD